MIAALHAKVLPAVALAASLMGAAMIVFAQSLFSPFAESVERILGGSVLFAAAYLIVRWTFRLLREARETAVADRVAMVEREKLLLEQLAAQTVQLAELNAQLQAERELRLSLEELGLIDRRRPSSAE